VFREKSGLYRYTLNLWACSHFSSSKAPTYKNVCLGDRRNCGGESNLRLFKRSLVSQPKRYWRYSREWSSILDHILLQKLKVDKNCPPSTGHVNTSIWSIVFVCFLTARRLTVSITCQSSSPSVELRCASERRRPATKFVSQTLSVSTHINLNIV